MDNFPWGDRRRFYSYNLFLKQRFGGFLQKLTLDAGFTCPNRDGTCGVGGCTFCLNNAFNPSYCTPQKSITTQLQEGMLFHQHRRREVQGYLAYFQAFSNTYAPLERLQKIYEEALSIPSIQGIIIATRPDCIDERLLAYLQQLSEHTYVALEIGIESCQDKTLQRVHRGHDFKCTTRALELIHKYALPVGVHLIFGLPNEKPEQWLQEIDIINQLPIHSIKFHQLQIIKGTALERDYQANPNDYLRMDFEAYIDFLVKYIERLRPNIVIERIASEVPPKYLSVSGWKNKRYDTILQSLEHKLEHQNTWQGKKYTLSKNQTLSLGDL